MFGGGVGTTDALYSKVSIKMFMYSFDSFTLLLILFLGIVHPKMKH